MNVQGLKMDTIQPPTKPPRGVKNSKETSGLLMTVIRTLSTSDSNEQRDQERMKLERDYKKSNQHLEQLVSIHHDDLTHVMNLFAKLSTHISQSKEKVHSAKENLLACKKLLTCRREELKKLWLESTEYKYTLQLLGEIEHIKGIPSQTVNLISQKEYLNATRTLIAAIETTETTLRDVVGLQELRTELELKKQELYIKLISEMKEQIYIQSTFEIIALKRQGSARNSVDQNTTSGGNRLERKITPRQSRYRPKKLLEVPNNMKNKSSKNEVQYSEDPEYIIGTLIECVMMLNKWSEFLEEMKMSVQRELTSLTLRTMKEFTSSDAPNVLLEYLQVIMEQLKRIIDCHSFMLDKFKTKYDVNSVYDLPFVWLRMQQVLQQLVSQYVDIQEIRKSESAVSENCDRVPSEQYDVNSYFVRKKQIRTVKGTLFKFDNASQGDGTSKTYEKETGKEKLLLCKPSSSNLTQVYVPLSRFAEEIERQVHGTSDKASKLNVFLNELVGQMFRGKRYEDIALKFNIYDKNGVTLPTKEMNVNGSSSASPNPLLTVSKPKMQRAFSYFL